MKSYVRALTALAVGGSMLAFAGRAQASTVTFASTVSFTESLVDLGFTSSGLNTTLTVGTPLTISNFIAVSVSPGAWSASSASLVANFAFTMPTPNGTTTDTGSVTGGQINGNTKTGNLSIVWPNQPVEFTFADGTKLDVTLGALSESCSGSNNCLASSDPYYMSATFLAVNGPVNAPPPGTTPLPAAAWLFGSAVALAATGRKLKKRNGTKVVA